MRSIWNQSNGILRYYGLHLSRDILNDSFIVERQVNQDIKDSGISFEQFCSSKILLDFSAEGHSDKDIVKLIDYLKSINIRQIAVMFGACVDTESLPYPALSISAAMVNHVDWFTNLKKYPIEWLTDCNFLCLLRRPSVDRAELASRLQSLGLDIRLSFGSSSYQYELTPYQHYFEDAELPLLIDAGPMFDEPGRIIYDVTSPLLRQCAVNIIAESSTQQSSNIWHSVFITEKTYKAFGMFQLPIWWAVPGLVAQVRKLGFDIFDDVIDHSYDNEVDQSQRMKLVINEVQRLNEYDLVSLRNQFKTRLESNYNLLDQLERNNQIEVQNFLKKVGYE